jgi:hypothetical protein
MKHVPQRGRAFVLAAAGAVLGLVSAHWAIVLLKGLISENMMNGLPFLWDMGLNTHVLAVAAVIAMASAALLSIPPSGRIWSSQVRSGLAEASRGSAGATWRRRFEDGSAGTRHGRGLARGCRPVG